MLWATQSANRQDSRTPQRRASVWHSSNLGSVLVTTSPESARDGAATAASIPRDPDAEPGNKSVFDYLSELSAPLTMLTVKSRYASASHWVYTAVWTVPALRWLDQETAKQGEFWQQLCQCKAIGENIKLQRLLVRIPGQYGSHIPDRATADRLLGNYLRTFETVYRIIHVPTFKREHEAFMQDPGNVSSGFIIRYQLCLALGATVYDDTFSFRSHALQWIHEAQEWLTASEKSRASIPGIQAMCLLQLIQQATESLYGDRVWILCGNLHRASMCLGFHRDPAKLPAMPPFQAEMRRRLWATILELVLDASLEAGQPPLITPDDFDCALPSNLDDDQLSPDTTSLPEAKDGGVYTDSSLQIALGRSRDLRLAIANHWCKIKPETDYSQILHLGSRLSTARRALMKTLHAMLPPISQFQLQYCDVVLMRYVFALHMPYVPLSSPAFCHSRNACVDAALQLSYMTLPLSASEEPLAEAIRAASGFREQCRDMSRLVTCGSGSFRSVQHIATSIIAADLARTVAADRGLSPSGSGLRAAEERWLLRASLEWAEQRIRAGQENVKDYVYFAVIVAGIEAGMEGDEKEGAMARGGRDAAQRALEILTAMAGGRGVPGPGEFQAAYTAGEGELDMIGSFWASDFPDLGDTSTTF
ncbi:Transcription factor lepE [Colletotrichum orbiculare MAFF 240422]|uniref:Transcription factor lepE n=1 Tax=Colletotrichum orbiculare (strain 104-T / ATCC 96160 / CBS 514.97 / LARS 414 / MAFF 240422) TaxID=1213857 RepID=A0A484FZQ9_COLOR|nr:Transcription factor lepE [Colletotrichum orbiculare MAFF 240422]